MRLFFIVAFDDNGEDDNQFVIADTPSEAKKFWQRPGDWMPPDCTVFELPMPHSWRKGAIEWEDLPSVKV